MSSDPSTPQSEGISGVLGRPIRVAGEVLGRPLTEGYRLTDALACRRGKLDLALAQQFLKVYQPFPMADAELAAQPVLREYVIARRSVEGPSTPYMGEPRS